MRVRPRPEVDALPGYRLTVVPAPIKLNQNESPYDLPPEVKEEVLGTLRSVPWNRYPPMRAGRLREAIARLQGVKPEKVILTNGSNEAILALISAFAAGGTVVLPEPGYSMARPLAVTAGAHAVAVRLREDLSMDPDALLSAAAASCASMIFFASPNNPTGRAVPPDDVERIVAGFRGLVVVDEAYWGFSEGTALRLLPERANVAVVRTASKAFGLAGVRVGWVTASRDVIAALDKTLPPYNLDVFAQAAAEAMVRRPDLVRERASQVVRERERVLEALRALGVEAFASEANFILFRTPDAAATFDGLARRGVLVRDVSHFPMLDGCLRVTVGTPPDNDAFLQALRQALPRVRASGGRSV
ncbi:MAG: histidinol-phosphate transaminase [Armatimonadota bacterium]|nr:histidinol-phosphate transaminase [Armatimonadota bacterium]MDR5697014.1 histidinol-phosphate transaminase [Armatimonadota bacterium]